VSVKNENYKKKTKKNTTLGLLMEILALTVLEKKEAQSGQIWCFHLYWSL
jgi:hypothetical protein